MNQTSRNDLGSYNIIIHTPSTARNNTANSLKVSSQVISIVVFLKVEMNLN